MNLVYKIAVVDDQMSSLDSTMSFITGKVTDQGFVVSPFDILARLDDPDATDAEQEIVSLIDQENPDLLLMDYKLGSLRTGDALIKAVRNTLRHLNVVFYSSSPLTELRDRIRDEQIDGVYCCTRAALAEEVVDLINVQLRRVMDINHMRGIVMAETSEIDSLLIECICDAQEAFGVDPLDFAEKAKARAAKKWEKQKQSLDALRLVREVVGSHHYQASWRLEVLEFLIRQIRTQPQGDDCGNVLHELKGHLNSYRDRVVVPRNALAHLREGEIVSGGTSDEQLRTLRKSIIEHRNHFMMFRSFLERLRNSKGC